ncbi:FAD:protein FMN transferase [Sphingopyxis panaciterrae]
MTHASAETRVERFAAMGTRVELHQFGRAAPDALLAGRRAIEAVDNALTIHRRSPTTAVNDRLMAGGVATTEDPVLLDALAAIAEAWHATYGLFDPTIGSGGGAAWPALSVDRSAGRIEATRPVAFDFGGFGKGFALDRAAAAMRAAGATSAFLSAGESSVAVIGEHPLGGAWPVAIPHPLDPERWLVELSLRDEALSVSSTVGAGAVAPGRSPMIRPFDSMIITAAATAVAVDASGAAAEAMSTALLVGDPDAAQRLIAADPTRRFSFAFDDPSSRVTA